MAKALAALGGGIVAYIIIWAFLLINAYAYVVGGVVSIVHHHLVEGILCFLIPPFGWVVGWIDMIAYAIHHIL